LESVGFTGILQKKDPGGVPVALPGTFFRPGRFFHIGKSKTVCPFIFRGAYVLLMRANVNTKTKERNA